jgi:hypothetical protein
MACEAEIADDMDRVAPGLTAGASGSDVSVKAGEAGGGMLIPPGVTRRVS